MKLTINSKSIDGMLGIQTRDRRNVRCTRIPWAMLPPQVFFVGWAISRCLSTTPHPIVVHGGSKLLEHLSSTPTHDMKRNELRSLVWNKRNFIFWTLQIAKWLFLRLLACQSISIYQVERAAWVSKNNFTVLEQKGDECSYWLKC